MFVFLLVQINVCCCYFLFYFVLYFFFLLVGLYYSLNLLRYVFFYFICTKCDRPYLWHVFFPLKTPVLCSSDHPILLKFCQFISKIVSKELQIVFLTYTFSISNAKMKELERKNPCKTDIPIGYL